MQASIQFQPWHWNIIYRHNSIICCNYVLVYLFIGQHNGKNRFVDIVDRPSDKTDDAATMFLHGGQYHGSEKDYSDR